ncbi:hypothetical protein CBS101457_003093 [Exobasidium rhododendri]|nr:hypothetical protein CBS101457_003093 [Exobasidium rhododendri]
MKFQAGPALCFLVTVAVCATQSCATPVSTQLEVRNDVEESLHRRSGFLKKKFSFGGSSKEPPVADNEQGDLAKVDVLKKFNAEQAQRVKEAKKDQRNNARNADLATHGRIKSKNLQGDGFGWHKN